MDSVSKPNLFMDAFASGTQLILDFSTKNTYEIKLLNSFSHFQHNLDGFLVHNLWSGR